MNDTGVVRESEYVLRRLGEAFPLSPSAIADAIVRQAGKLTGVDLGGITAGVLAVVVGVLVLLGLGLVYRAFRADARTAPRWALPLAVVRLVGLALIGIAMGFPGMRFEPVSTTLFGSPVDVGPVEHAAWLFFVAGVLVYGLAFVAGGYVRDSQAVRWYWAVPLGLLRAGVYVLLAGAFLLPAVQTWEKTEKRSRVVVVVDVSPSVVDVTDDLVRDSTATPPTRMDKLLDLLSGEGATFVDKLLEKNPVVVYRFGTRLDDEGVTLGPDTPQWTPAEWRAWVAYDFKPWVLRGLSPAGRDAVSASARWQPGVPGTADWAVEWANLADEEAIPPGLEPADLEALKLARGRLEKRIDLARSIVTGTNVADSLTGVVNRESANMVQAIIVFSDGRNNLGGASAVGTLKERAAQEKVPIFTVALGEPRENIGIQITELQVPDRAAPDEQFKLVVEADGVGLGGREVEVLLDLYLPSRDPKTDPADHQLLLPLKFQPGDPPHGQAEFVIDPAVMPDLLIDTSEEAGGKKQLKSGEWHAVARIARDGREVFPDQYHVSPPRAFQVIDKPIRVLLFAGGPTREYQTLRTLLARETNANRAELSVYLQTEGGRDGTAVQDVPAERLLNRFPTRLDTTEKATDKPEDKYYNLNEYDLIVAFDPDWSELSDDQVANLQTWVDNLGGGFAYVAGPIHTYQLARADEGGRLKPLLELLPVLPDDIILLKTRSVPRTPRRLLLTPNPDFDVLRLADGEGDDPTAGWEPYFTGRDELPAGADVRSLTSPEDGIYGFYPVKETKPGSVTLAEFLDVNDRGDPDPKPWLVTTQPVRGRTAFLGSGEIYRLRSADRDYYDRFWIKLARYLSANRDAKASRGRVLMGKEYVSGAPVRVQARLLNPSGRPYGEDDLNPKFKVVAYSGDGEPLNKEFGPFELKAKKSASGFDGYYTGQVQADPRVLPPGDFRYRVVVDVPDSPGDTISSEFLVRQADPELDETRPDFVYLADIASPVTAIEPRVKDADVLAKVRGSAGDPAKAKLSFRLAERERLGLIPACLETKFQNSRNRGPVEDLWDKPLPLNWLGLDATLVDARLTPASGFVVSAVVFAVAIMLVLFVVVSLLLGRGELNLGTVPLAVVVLLFGLLGVAGMVASRVYEFDQRVTIGGLLLVVVALLSAEWATRKLLRLA